MAADRRPLPVDEPHRQWLRDFFTARRTYDQRRPDDPLYHAEAENDPAYVEMDRLRDLLERTEFHTPAGALARLALMADQSLVHEVDVAVTRAALLRALAIMGISGWSSP